MRQSIAAALALASAGVLAASLAVAALDPSAAPPPAAASAQSAPSEAERLVFLHDHLAGIRAPRSLRYRYLDEAGGSPPTTDTAVLKLAAGSGGRCCDVHGDYLSGAMAVRLPDFTQVQANPIVLYFLEGEVRRLQRTTSGQAAHFRRRIRQALADQASVTDSTIRWAGQAAPARTVRVAPFLDDPFRNRFSEQAATEYAIVLSDAVPGGVYQLSATLPGPAAGANALARRSLTIEEPTP